MVFPAWVSELHPMTEGEVRTYLEGGYVSGPLVPVRVPKSVTKGKPNGVVQLVQSSKAGTYESIDVAEFLRVLREDKLAVMRAPLKATNPETKQPGGFYKIVALATSPYLAATRHASERAAKKAAGPAKRKRRRRKRKGKGKKKA